jgi:hypothetical protein
MSRQPAAHRDTAPTDEALTQILALDAAGRLRAALIAVVGGRGRGFTDPPPGGLLAGEVERVFRITGQAVALGLADTGRAASWLAAPSPAQRRWLRDALGWSSALAPPRPPPPPVLPPSPIPVLAIATATAAAFVIAWLGGGIRRRRHLATRSGGSGCGGGSGTATADAALLTAGAILAVAGATALFRRV